MAKIKRTSRGFAYLEFTDIGGKACSLQRSSLAKNAIWLGVDCVNAEEWRSVHGVDMTQLPARMHLTRKQVKNLLPFLQHFAETGELE